MMKSRLTFCAVLLLCLGAAAQTTTTSTSTTKTTRRTRSAKTGSTAEEIKGLRDAIAAQQSTIRQQQQQIQQLQDQVQQVQSSLQDQTSRVQDAESKATAATSSATQQEQAVTQLRTDVSDIKTSTTSTAVAVQQEQVEKKSFEDKIKQLGPFTFSGDFRLRDEPFFGGPTNESQDRNRVRYRLRFNANAKLNQDISGGLSLATGDINDPISTNQTVNQFFTRKPFLLDRAFINYTPHQLKVLTLTGGKMAYPWYRTELTWDNDLNPEGVAEKLEWKSEKTPVFRQLALVGFQLPFAEVAGVNFNFPNTNQRSIHQSVVYGGQVQTGWQLGSAVKFTADGAFYNYHNPDPIAFAIATVNGSSPANGLLKLGGSSFQNSYQQVTVATPTCLPPLCATTTNVNSSIVNAKLNSRFAMFDGIAQFDIKTPLDAWPVRILGDYVQNTGACGNVQNPVFVPTVSGGAKATVSTVNGACNPRQRRGYWLEGRVGRTQKKGDVQLAYTRMFIEREAVMSAFNFSDLRQNSNVTQHRMEFAYQALNNIQFAFTGLIGRPLGSTEPYLKRFQFDVIYKF